jgi:spore coat polysaccharide biosynthesis protein SpsF (cytidylyltransferase family)
MEKQRIQLSENDFKEIYDFFIQLNSITDFLTYEAVLDLAKRKSFIKKSQIKLMVEQAEDYYNIYKIEDYNKEFEKAFIHDTIFYLYKVIQELKKDHPEFKK